MEYLLYKESILVGGLMTCIPSSCLPLWEEYTSLGDIKIYALVLVEFSSSLKMWKSLLVSLDSVAVRALPTIARLLLDLYMSA